MHRAYSCFRRRFWLSSVLATLTWLATSNVQAAITMVLTPDRELHAAITNPATGGTEAATPSISALFGIFAPAPVAISDAGPLGMDSASADQNSTTPNVGGPSIYGNGHATGSADWTGPSGFSVMADSFFDVFFQVDVSGTYDLAGSVDSVLAGSGTAFAKVELFDTGFPAIPLLSELADPAHPGHAFGSPILLMAGSTYELKAKAFVSFGGGFGTASGDASWDFRLDPQAVPEPSSLVVMAGLGLCFAVARRGFRRQCLCRLSDKFAGPAVGPIGSYRGQV